MDVGGISRAVDRARPFLSWATVGFAALAVVLSGLAFFRREPPRVSFPLARTDIRGMARSYAPVGLRQEAEAWRDGADVLEKGATLREATEARWQAIRARADRTLYLWAHSRFPGVCSDAPEPQTEAERAALVRQWRGVADGLESWAVAPGPAPDRPDDAAPAPESD